MQYIFNRFLIQKAWPQRRNFRGLSPGPGQFLIGRQLARKTMKKRTNALQTGRGSLATD
jgi:hypothetical protein